MTDKNKQEVIDEETQSQRLREQEIRTRRKETTTKIEYDTVC